jgi:hypothetical protein
VSFDQSSPEERPKAVPTIISDMDTTEIIQTIDAEIARLEQAKTLLSNHTAPTKRGRPFGSKPAGMSRPLRRTMSAEARERIAAAQRARGAKARRK